MTESEKISPKDDSTKSREAPPESRNLTTRVDLLQRLSRGHDARTRFVESHTDKTLAFQIRALRGDMSQEKAMEKLGMNQNAISRLENPYYGKATLTTLKRIAAAYDVGLLVEFVPFSKLIDHVSGTPHLDPGLGPSTMNVPSFEEELPELESTETQSSAESIQWLTEVYWGVAAGLSNATLQERGEAAGEAEAAVNVVVPPITGSLLDTPQSEPVAGKPPGTQWSWHQQRDRERPRFAFRNPRRPSRRGLQRRSRLLRGAYAR